MAKIEAGPPGEYILAETEKDNEPAGDCIAEGGSDWRKEAGEEGGATKGSTGAGAWIGFSEAEALAPGAVVSDEMTACPIRFLGIRFPCLGDPKHQYKLQKLPHLVFCK